MSHAIRSLNQGSPTINEAQRREAKSFKERIRSQYSDIIEHIPVEFECWLDNKVAGIYFPEQQEQINELLMKLSYEIQRETRA